MRAGFGTSNMLNIKIATVFVLCFSLEARAQYNGAANWQNQITRTPKGCAASTTTNATISNVTIRQGGSLLVVGNNSGSTSPTGRLTWNGIALTRMAYVKNDDWERAWVYGVHDVAAGTGSIVGVPEGSGESIAYCAAVYTNLDPSPVEIISTAIGSGTTAASGTVATTWRNDLFVGGVSIETTGGSTAAFGSWGDLKAGQKVGIDLIASYEGFKILSNTATLQANIGLSPSQGWAAVIAAFRKRHPVIVNYPKGMTSSKTSSVTLSNITLTTGRSIIVSVAAKLGGGDSISGVTWNGISLVQDGYASSTVASGVYSLHNVTGATANVVATGTAGVGAIAITVNEVSGLASNPKDKSSTATGSGTTPSSGATATLTQATEFAIGAVATLGPGGSDDDAAGTWTSPFWNGQRVGTTGNPAASNATISDAFTYTSSTGAVTAAKTGIASRAWAATVVTYKAKVP